MTTEEKIDNLQEAEYLRGLAEGYSNAAKICTSLQQKSEMLTCALSALVKCKEIQSKIKD